jgi:type IV secretion system protein VirB10
MPVKEIGDPRLRSLFGTTDPRDVGIRPRVRLPSKGLSPIAFAFAMLVFAALLFALLNYRRTSQVQPSVRSRATDSQVTGWDAPPLYIPPVEAPRTYSAPLDQPKPAPQLAIPPAPALGPKTALPQVGYTPQPRPQLAPPSGTVPQPRVSSGAPLVIDIGSVSTATTVPGPISSPLVPSGQSVTRMRASALANRSTTVPQGYLIPAVLETGLDSTRPGFARAIVSRDVRGFDGKNVLIPRGSRLIGEYRSEIAQGQNRAIITWTRLIRPDGMTIAMDSPAVDTLGRGGVAASVNSHFFARLGDALLQSTIGLGQAVAGRAVTGPVVVVSGTTMAAPAQATPTSATTYVPTLTVPPGKSISVFVAHDLDFSAAGATR